MPKNRFFLYIQKDTLSQALWFALTYSFTHLQKATKGFSSSSVDKRKSFLWILASKGTSRVLKVFQRTFAWMIFWKGPQGSFKILSGVSEITT